MIARNTNEMCGRETKFLAITFVHLGAAAAAAVYLLVFRSSDSLTVLSVAVLLNVFPAMLLLSR